MKKNNKVLVVLTASVLACGTFLGFENNKVKRAEASYSTTTPTRNIDLNDCSDTEIKNYYSNSSVEGKSGSQLLAALKERLKNGQQYFSYDSSGTNIWKVLKNQKRRASSASRPGIMTWTGLRAPSTART